MKNIILTDNQTLRLYHGESQVRITRNSQVYYVSNCEEGYYATTWLGTICNDVKIKSAWEA